MTERQNDILIQFFGVNLCFAESKCKLTASSLCYYDFALLKTSSALQNVAKLTDVAKEITDMEPANNGNRLTIRIG